MLVRNKNIKFFLVLAIAGNKIDNYIEEIVTEEEGMNLAKELNAIFQLTSAKEEDLGINELFEKIGKKLLDRDSKIISNFEKEELKDKTIKLKKDEIKKENKNKKNVVRKCFIF